MTGGNIESNVAGGPVRHKPVMLNEVLACLSPSEGQLIVDGTFGAGGYSKALLDAGCSVLAIDRDPNAVRDGAALVSQFDGRLTLLHGEFSEMQELIEAEGLDPVDGVVLDIGVSSMQLDEADRGFSFQADGPLDMRMSQEGVSAADVVNNAAQPDLTRIIGLLGEERKASFISREIVKVRQKNLFQTTRELAEVIESVVRRKPQDKIHPATRTFQALRIFVNQELQQLAKVLFAAENILRAGGRLAVVTFHSLEDRIVKLFFKDRLGSEQGSRHMPLIANRNAVFEIDGRGLIKASPQEAEVNPRARSAKLRWGRRTSSPPMSEDMSIFGFPNLVELSSMTAGGR